MKKLIWCLAAVGVLCIIVVVTLGRNPDNAILAIQNSHGQGYEQLMVVKRDRSFEQLIRRTGDETIIKQSGTWLPTKEDVNGGLLAAHTGKKAEDYITFKHKLHPDRKDGSIKTVDFSLEPESGLQPPNEESLKKWKEWSATAQTYTPGERFKSPQSPTTPQSPKTLQPLLPKN